MPDQIDANGLQVKTLTEIRDELVASLEAIYGTDINTNQNSPDGQQINIYAQGGVDLREVLTKINASFDPDQAVGIILDQRVALNGLTRNAGTYTFQNIEVIIDRAISLIGLDGEAAELNPDVPGLFTIKDDEGNEFYLLASQTEAGAGTYTYNFRAAAIGLVEVIPNTITTVVTITLGVTGVNNPSAANSIGVDEESDFDLKIRRQQGTALPALGYLDAIEAQLSNLDNVTIAIVYENVTSVTDSNGIPPHSIWAIVEGGDPDEIADIIYKKKSFGSGMKGIQIVTINRPNGTTIDINYDIPTAQNLYIQFNLSGATYDPDDIKSQIVAGLFWDIGKNATSDVVTCFVKSINNNFVIQTMEVSDDGAAWTQIISPTGLSYRFTNDTTRITIT